MKTNTLIRTILPLAFAAICFNSCSQQAKPGEDGFYEGIEFSMERIAEPDIPGYSVSITDFGAVNGGQTLNTEAFADAIAAVTSKGGGKVVVPPGIWLTGPIILESNLELHAEYGALILFSDDKDLYPLVKTSFEGLSTWRCISPIYGKDISNVAFTGRGVWDGNGDAWRHVKKSKLTSGHWKELVRSGGVVDSSGEIWYPSEQYKQAAEESDMNVPRHLKTKEDYEKRRDFLRPVMVSIQHAERVLFDGPVFQNSPAWCIHPLIVEDLVMRNLTIRNPWYSQNGDGIDIESCKNVLIENCNLDVGDDAICIKSGKDENGRARGIPAENLVIRNNIVYHGHGGVTVGSEMSGGVRNMHVSGCTFIGTDVGLRFKSNRGRGGVVENIYISDIRMIDIPTFAISFNLYYGGKSVPEMLADGDLETISKKEPVNEGTPQFRNIQMSDITINGARQAVMLQGLPEMKLENITLSDMFIVADEGFTIADADGVKLENIQLTTEKGNALGIYNSENIRVTDLDHPFGADENITIRGAESRSISITTKDRKDISELVELGEEVDEDALMF